MSGNSESGGAEQATAAGNNTLVVSGNHDVIVYTVNSLHLAQNMPNAKLVLYPDANHGSWYQYHDAFVAETNGFLNA